MLRKYPAEVHVQSSLLQREKTCNPLIITLWITVKRREKRKKTRPETLNQSRRIHGLKSEKLQDMFFFSFLKAMAVQAAE